MKGYYKLRESDGSTREVQYTADKENGFMAQVKKSGESQPGSYVSGLGSSYQVLHKAVSTPHYTAESHNDYHHVSLIER